MARSPDRSSISRRTASPTLPARSAESRPGCRVIANAAARLSFSSSRELHHLVTVAKKTPRDGGAEFREEAPCLGASEGDNDPLSALFPLAFLMGLVSWF